MPNRSKTRDSRSWEKWRDGGATRYEPPIHFRLPHGGAACKEPGAIMFDKEAFLRVRGNKCPECQKVLDSIPPPREYWR